MTQTLSANFLSSLLHGQAPTTTVPDATGISFNSQTTQQGDVFFALPGANSHGVHYADDALSKGAAFIVSDKPHPKAILVADAAKALLNLGAYARQQHKGAIIGVTGSAGKTSTKNFIAAALNAQVSPGNFNTPFALAKTLTENYLNNHTSETDTLVLELGIDHAGEMATLVALVKPTHAVVTLIAASHLEGLGTVEMVAKEKLLLAQAASVSLVSTQVFEFLPEHLKSRVLTYGVTPEQATYVASRTTDGAQQQLCFQNHTLRLPYPGKAMAINAVAALALATQRNIPIKTACERLSQARLESARLQVHDLNGITLIDDSYNSNPASAEEALATLKTFPGPHTAILGDMLELGSDGAFYHRQLGQQSKSLHQTIAVGPLSAFMTQQNPNARYYPTVDALLKDLHTLEFSGTVLVKASRGMRFERICEALVARFNGVAS